MKILIIRLSSLGDVVLTQPIADNFRKIYPQATIDYLTKPQFKPIVEAFGCIDNIYLWEKYEKKELIKTLKKKKYDLVIDLQAKINTFIIKTLIFPKQKITYQKKHFLRLLIIKKLTSKQIESTLNLYSTVFTKLNIPFEIKYPVLFPQNTGIFFDLSSGKINIAIFPGAKHNTKRFPVQRYCELINKLSKKINCNIIILGSKNEFNICQTIQEQTQNIYHNYCGKFSLKELMDLINKVDLVISNDSGPMHIAAAFEKKQVAIFGSTSTKLGFKPLNKNAVIIQSNIVCQPCTLHGRKNCPLGHFKCMDLLNTDAILQSIIDILNL